MGAVGTVGVAVPGTAFQFHVRQSIPLGSVLATFHSPDNQTEPAAPEGSAAGSADAPE
jgi:hypothetical protein